MAKKETVIYAWDKVTFTYNGKDKFHKAGVKERIHPELAAKLEEKGFGKVEKDTQKRETPKGFTATADTDNENKV